MNIHTMIRNFELKHGQPENMEKADLMIWLQLRQLYELTLLGKRLEELEKTTRQAGTFA